MGVALALVGARVLQGLLFGVTARGPLTLVAVSAVVGLVVLAACYVPGRRALGIEPTMALRAE